MEIEIEYTEKAICNIKEIKDVNDLFEFIENLTKKTFEPLGMEIKHITIRVK